MLRLRLGSIFAAPQSPTGMCRCPGGGARALFPVAGSYDFFGQRLEKRRGYGEFAFSYSEPGNSGLPRERANLGDRFVAIAQDQSVAWAQLRQIFGEMSFGVVHIHSLHAFRVD